MCSAVYHNFSKTGEVISKKIGKAIGDYNLIQENDKLLVAVSGGKDSLTLLKMLYERQKWSPCHYDICVIHVRTDFVCGGCTQLDAIKSVIDKMELEFCVRDVKVVDENKKTNCFWCSWNRRKAFFEVAEELGCNKIALGHHKDDIIETTLLNMFFQGEVSTMRPRQEFFKGKIEIIRPLCYVTEEVIIKYAEEQKLIVNACRCPYGQVSNRKRIKDIISNISQDVPGTDIRSNIFNSVAKFNIEK